jgi:predicted RNA polymerase sigma factor
MATAKHRAIDKLRRDQLLERKHVELAHELEAALDDATDMANEALDDPIGDDLLRLMFTACHPLLSTEARVALTLRLLGSLTTDEIARAFFVPEPTITAHRQTRSVMRRFLKCHVVGLAERPCRARATYLIFNEGYGTAGATGCARSCARRRCGRIPGWLLVKPRRRPALMELQPRAHARTGPNGELVLLSIRIEALGQLLIRRGLKALELAETCRYAALHAAGRHRHARARVADKPTGGTSPRCMRAAGAAVAVSSSMAVAVGAVQGGGGTRNVDTLISGRAIASLLPTGAATCSQARPWRRSARRI